MPRKEKKYHYLYKTTNNLSGRYYYGMHSTDNLNDGYLGSGTQLRRAIKKHGKKAFTIEMIEFCKDRESLKNKESELVTLQEISKKECMNLRVGGGGMDYKPPVSDETRKKMSEAQKKRPINWDAINKMVEARTGSHHTDEAKKKISESNIGKTHTDDMKEHLSEVSKKLWQNDEYIDKVRKAMKAGSKANRSGVTLSDETKNKISQSKKGKKITPQKRITCPHCSKEGGASMMKRYHFDNCKNK
jgi:hypothetical protein|tara:strand:+ start:570 stop:1304 length:735 start_codon:yes stop_codon:yes gene_type:complete